MSFNSDTSNAPAELPASLRVLACLAYLSGLAVGCVVIFSVLTLSFMTFLPSVALCVWLFKLGFALIKMKPWVIWGVPVFVYLLVFVIGITMLMPFWLPGLDRPLYDVGEIVVSALPIWAVGGMFIYGLLFCLSQLRTHRELFTNNLPATRT